MTDDLPPTIICPVAWDDLTRREKLAEFWHDLDWIQRLAFFGAIPAALLMMATVVAWAVIT